MLNPPDPSRGHPPILALFLANPGRTLSEAELHAALPELSLGSLRNRLAQHTRCGQLLRSGGAPARKTGARHGATYRAATPFPPSWREQHTVYERERRAGLRAAGERRTDRGETGAAARRSRFQATRQRRVSNLKLLQAGILAHFRANPDQALNEAGLRKHVRGNPALMREALLDLCAGGQLHAAVDHDTPSVFRLPLVRTPARKPRSYGLHHHEVYALAARRPVTEGQLARTVEAHLGVTARVARGLIHGLYHGAHLDLRPVGDTCVVRVAAPLPAEAPAPAHAA